MTLAGAVRSAEARLAEAGVPSPEADATALVAHLLGVAPGEVRRLMVLGAEAPEGLAALVEERARRVPLQHLTGQAHFRRLTLAVGPGVFVPRPETELLAGLGIREAASPPAPVVVDLCSGSGAVAFAVKDEVPRAEVYAVELTAEAHAWAQRNRTLLGLDVRLVRADARTTPAELKHLVGTVDVVLANPPYIPTDAVPVDPEVREHDPERALYGGSPDGLATPVTVGGTAAELLRPGGFFAMEHADVQAPALVAALRRAGRWRSVEDHLDLNDRPRCVSARRR